MRRAGDLSGFCVRRCKTVANFCSKVYNLVMCGSETFEYKIVREKKKIEKI
jgi:hypothetical protein